ncbi:hypothetical protein SAMN06269185_1252 [Natronoarchaeum philippinense]|uniref:Uncharacterized protein n=2 Tax=Natronoarchaeum philippinense TaxID=558529 RepID=A0A285NGA3_NATPI|nr:hypothetical protein SAMN06269185_1252 [Natronoarchaeum philippinense]
MVHRDGEELLDRTIEFTAADAGDKAASAIIEPLWSASGEYTVRARHVDESGDTEAIPQEYSFTEEDYTTYYGDSHEDPGCIGAVVTVGARDETANAQIGIGPTYLEDPCSTSNPVP